MRERRSKNKTNETEEEREQRQNRDKERQRAARARKSNKKQNTNQNTNRENEQTGHQSEDSEPTTNSEATTISEEEHRVLQEFRVKMDNISYKVCGVCNERIPEMTLIKNIMCRRCHSEKNEPDVPKKFSAENNMDPGEVPDELKGLTEIEEMLIAR